MKIQKVTSFFGQALGTSLKNGSGMSCVGGVELPESFESCSFRQAFELVAGPLGEVEERIRAQARAFDPQVEGYITYVCNKRGKRLRPALTLLAGGATGEVGSRHIDLAVVIELIHVATLVHDDIIDGATMRREQPTANAKWGNAISVLLGDALFAHALRLATGFEDREVCRKIADAAAEVCSGEIIQTQRRFDLKLTVEDYFRIIEMKTAALFGSACELGAVLSEASEEVIQGLRNFGIKLGTAYQIYDDILDLMGREEDSGKTLGTDLKKGKFTLPVLLLLENGRHEEVSFLLLDEASVDLEVLNEILKNSTVISESGKVVQELVNESLESLEVVPPSASRSGLAAIARRVSRLSEELFKS